MMSGTTVVRASINKAAEILSVLRFLPFAVAIGFCGLCLWLIIRELGKHKEVLQKDRVVDCLKRFGKLLWSFKWYILFSLLYIAGDVKHLADAPMKNNLIFKINNSWQYANQAVFIATMQQALCIDILILLLGFCNMKNHPRIAKILFLLPWIWWAAGVIREGSGDLVMQFLISVGIVLLWQGWCLIWRSVKRKVLFLVCVIVCSLGLGSLWLISYATCCAITTGSLSIHYYDARGRLEKIIFRASSQFEEYTRIYNESGEIDTEITRSVNSLWEGLEDFWEEIHPLIITQYQYTYDENGRKKYADAYVCAEGECKFKERTFYEEQGREIPENTDRDFTKKTYDKYGNLQKETFDNNSWVHYWVNPKWKQNLKGNAKKLPSRMGSFNDGKKEGLWRYYYENRDLKAEGYYKAGNKDGEWIYYNLNGQVEEQETYESGKKNGAYKKFHANGKLQSEGNYTDDKKEGLWKYYDKDGKLEKEVIYQDKVKTFKKYNKNGQLTEEGGYKNVKQDGHDRWGMDGVWKYYYDNGHLEEETSFKHGVRNGIYRKYDENGRLREEGSYINGRQSAKWNRYDEYGNIEIKEGVVIHRRRK